jgi:hypothetical protein
MDLLYAISAGSASLGWGPASGNLVNNLPLGFSCHWIAVMPGNRVLYVTGNKGVSGTRHAWLAVVDTCDNTVVAEVDMGLGFAGQCAVPAAPGGPSAYVTIYRGASSRSARAGRCTWPEMKSGCSIRGSLNCGSCRARAPVSTNSEGPISTSPIVSPRRSTHRPPMRDGSPAGW